MKRTPNPFEDVGRSDKDGFPITSTGRYIKDSDGPLKTCPDCGNWIRVSMEPCGKKRSVT